MPRRARKPSPAVIRYAAQTSTGVPTSPRTQGSANTIRVTPEQRSCTVKDHFRLVALPPEADEHEVNARTPLERIIDRCRISRDHQSGIANDPNARFEEANLARGLGSVVRFPSSNQFHHVRFLRFRRPTRVRAISVPLGRAGDQDHPVVALDGGADFILPLPGSADDGLAVPGRYAVATEHMTKTRWALEWRRNTSVSTRRGSRCGGRRGSGSLRRSAQPGGRRSGAGRSQKTPSGVIQVFHLCGTNCGTTFLIDCFY